MRLITNLEKVPSVAVFRVEGEEEEDGLREGGRHGRRREDCVRRIGRERTTEGGAEVWGKRAGQPIIQFKLHSFLYFK